MTFPRCRTGRPRGNEEETMLHVFFATLVAAVALAQVTVLQQWVQGQAQAGTEQAMAGWDVRPRELVQN